MRLARFLDGHFAIFRQIDLVPHAVQHFAHQGQIDLAVIDDKDAPGGMARRIGRGRRFGQTGRCPDLGRNRLERDLEMEAAALAGETAHEQFAPLHVHATLGDREAQPGAGLG